MLTREFWRRFTQHLYHPDSQNGITVIYILQVATQHSYFIKISMSDIHKPATIATFEFSHTKKFEYIWEHEFHCWVLINITACFFIYIY